MPDIFDSRVMTRALHQMQPAHRFVLDTFYGDSDTHPTDNISIDIFRGGREIAPFQRPTAEGHVLADRGYETGVAKAPYLKPKTRTDADDLLKRRPGENPYSDRSPQERGREKLRTDMDRLRNGIRRREEWMATRGIVDGKVRVKGLDGADNDVDYEIDYRMLDSHRVELTSADRWNDGGDPVTDLMKWMSLISRDSGLTASHALVGEDVARALLDNTKTQNLLDNRRIEAGQLELRQQGGRGVIYLGNIGVDLYQYNEFYEDPASGDLKPIVPADRVVVGSADAYCKRHYGVIQDVHAGNPEVEYFAKSWMDQDPPVRWVQVQSSPLPVPHQIDGFVSAKVI
ncbi:MAG: major capsid protein [Thiohalospira sp.]